MSDCETTSFSRKTVPYIGVVITDSIFDSVFGHPDRGFSWFFSIFPRCIRDHNLNKEAMMPFLSISYYLDVTHKHFSLH